MDDSLARVMMMSHIMANPFMVGMITVVCFSSQFVKVPCHAQLSRAFNPNVHRRLVSTNWVRTA